LEYYTFNSTIRFESDIGGTNEFSGCGYYNLLGKLAFLHSAAGNFQSKNGTVYEEDEDDSADELFSQKRSLILLSYYLRIFS
jgi:hypothetical protein